MEMNPNDSEGIYAQNNFQQTSNENVTKGNQLLMDIPNDVESSGNETTTEDLSPAPTDDRSPMLTPNTPQDWLNEDNIESTIHQAEAIPATDRIMKSNLKEGTQNLMYWNPENAENIVQHTDTVTEDSSLEHSEQSSVTEDQPQGIHLFKIWRKCSLHITGQNIENINMTIILSLPLLLYLLHFLPCFELLEINFEKSVFTLHTEH
jgi:hypothetical protein